MLRARFAEIERPPDTVAAGDGRDAPAISQITRAGAGVDPGGLDVPASFVTCTFGDYLASGFVEEANADAQ